MNPTVMSCCRNSVHAYQAAVVFSRADKPRLFPAYANDMDHPICCVAHQQTYCWCVVLATPPQGFWQEATLCHAQQLE